jgi:hypothetical protein
MSMSTTTASRRRQWLDAGDCCCNAVIREGEVGRGIEGNEFNSSDLDEREVADQAQAIHVSVIDRGDDLLRHRSDIFGKSRTCRAHHESFRPD